MVFENAAKNAHYDCQLSTMLQILTDVALIERLDSSTFKRVALKMNMPYWGGAVTPLICT